MTRIPCNRMGCWKRCASKSEQRLSVMSDEFNQVMAALTNLAMCLAESGHQAEAAEVEQTLRNTLCGIGVKGVAK